MPQSSSSLLLILRFLTLFLVWATLQPVRGTFSIVAVDTHTREVGSAGASCVLINGSDARIIAVVIPDKGAINVQSLLDESAKAQAAELFRMGHNSTYVMSNLPRRTQFVNKTSQFVDAHQYAAVDIHGGTATHSGPYCIEKVETVEGNASSRFFFSIAGNMLDSKLRVTRRMKNAFENTQGSATLTDRLMAALQAGDMVGADRRCAEVNQSATGAYLQMARPIDKEDHLSVNISVTTSDPISALSLKNNELRKNITTTSIGTTRTTASNAFVAQGLTVIVVLLLFVVS